MTADVELLPLPPLYIAPSVEPVDYPNVAQALMDYALANVAHATAAKDAEIEALRAEVERYKVAWEEFSDRTEWVQQTAKPRELGMHRADVLRLRIEQAEARSERLAEALRELKDLMLRQVKWEPCDCGCPQQRTPAGPHSVTWLRAAQQVEIAISKAEGKE